MSAQGHIFQINASNGGVPKYPLRQAEVSELGITEDRHRNMQVHGGPQRALCLYSLESILALQAEGHPIFPGSIGENLTLAGLDWSEMTPGVQIQLGDQVLIELTHYTTPCVNIRESFLGNDILRVSQEQHPGWSRLYARVRQGGAIQVGDLAIVLGDDHI
ncbi:MAG: MOSC domain-containing protein [Omnitrophica WOR_2 bacterium]